MDWSSWSDITANDYMDIAYIKQVNQNIIHVKELITKYLLSIPEYESIDTSLEYQTQPLPEYINLVEHNLNYLEEKITWLVNRQKGRNWLGEYNDNPSFNYSDVNRWFSDLLIMKLALDSIPKGWRMCGTFSCGNNYFLQTLRR